MNEEFTPEGHEVPQQENPRVAAMLQEIARLQKAVESAREAIRTRESKPEFQKAKELFKDGYRLRNWGAQLTDTIHETVLTKDGKEIGYWADGTNRNTEEAFGLLGVGKNEGVVLQYLTDLTEEE